MLWLVVSFVISFVVVVGLVNSPYISSLSPLLPLSCLFLLRSLFGLCVLLTLLSMGGFLALKLLRFYYYYY